MLTRGKQYAEARRAIEGVDEPATTNQRIAFHRLKAAIASGLNEPDIAAAEMNAALELDPGNTSLLSATAVAQEQLGDIEEQRGESVEAVKAYQAAVALAPDREQYRVALALEFVQHYTFEPAIAVLTQAAPLFPKSAKIRTLLGVSQYVVRNLDQALEALTDAVELDSELEPARAYLAQIALESNSAPPQRTFDALCRSDKVVCAALRVRFAPEKAAALAVLKQAPSDEGVAKCELGRAYEHSGDLTAAREQLEACVRLQPSAQNHYRLGLVYGRLGLGDLARKQMALQKEAIAKATEESDRRRSAIQTFRYVLK